MSRVLEWSDGQDGIRAGGTNQNIGMERGYLRMSPGRILTPLGGSPSVVDPYKSSGTPGELSSV